MWNVDFVQFARLLDEINAVGLTADQVKAVAASMNIKPGEIKELLDRATAKWDELKKVVIKKTPLTEEQISEELAENGKVEAVVTMDFGEILGALEEVESFLDDLETRVAGDIVLADLEYKVIFADNDTLYIKVIGNAENSDDNEIDDEIDDEEVE